MLNFSASLEGNGGHRPRSGFTLIEVIIALAIAGLALGMLTAEIETGLAGAKLSGRYVEATRRAQSKLETLAARRDLTPGDSEGDDGNGFIWHVHIAKRDTHPSIGNPRGNAALALCDVEVTISWQSGNLGKTVTLWTEALRADNG